MLCRIGGQRSRQILCPAALEIRCREIMSTISEGLQAITARIGAAAAAAGRAPEDIQLVAVSKSGNMAVAQFFMWWLLVALGSGWRLSIQRGTRVSAMAFTSVWS